MYTEVKSETIQPIMEALRKQVESGVCASAQFEKAGIFLLSQSTRLPTNRQSFLLEVFMVLDVVSSPH